MNPATPQTLDPKLKEAYDRVMGSVVQPSNPPPAPKAEPVNTSPVQTQHFTAGASQQAVVTPIQPVRVNVSAPSKTVASGRKLAPIIFAVVGLSFFALYTVVWLKVFGIF